MKTSLCLHVFERFMSKTLVEIRNYNRKSSSLYWYIPQLLYWYIPQNCTYIYHNYCTDIYHNYCTDIYQNYCTDIYHNYCTDIYHNYCTNIYHNYCTDIYQVTLHSQYFYRMTCLIQTIPLNLEGLMGYLFYSSLRFDYLSSKINIESNFLIVNQIFKRFPSTVLGIVCKMLRTKV